MKIKVRDRLATLLHQNYDPHREEMLGRAKDAIEVSAAHSKSTAKQQLEMQRLLASVRREVAVIQLGRERRRT